MKLLVDENTDVIHLRLDETKIIESDEVSPGVVLDYNESKKVVGIEIRSLSKRASRLNLKEWNFSII